MLIRNQRYGNKIMINPEIGKCVCVENKFGAERAFQLIFPIVTGIHLVIHCSLVVAAVAVTAASMSPNNFTIFALQAGHGMKRDERTISENLIYNLHRGLNVYYNVQNERIYFHRHRVECPRTESLNCSLLFTFLITRSIDLEAAAIAAEKGASGGWKGRGF